MRIDSHSHIFSLNGVEYHRGMPLLDYQKDIGVEMCGVIAGDDEEQELLVETVRRYPQKFYGIGYVDHKNLYPSLKKIEGYIKEGVIRGIKMHPYVQLFQLDDPKINPIYELALSYDIPVIFHVGWLNFNTIDPTRDMIADYRYSCMGFPVQFGNVMERYPKLKLIAATWEETITLKCWQWQSALRMSIWIRRGWNTGAATAFLRSPSRSGSSMR